VNLESLRKRNVCKVALEDGSEWHLRKLSASASAIVGNAFLAAGHTDPDGPPPTTEQRADAFALLLSKSICDESGALTLDSDEARQELANLDAQTLLELGAKAQEWSTPAQSKKN
jgi:hypothetical protein